MPLTSHSHAVTTDAAFAQDATPIVVRSLETVRDQGLRRRLKELQRVELARRGVARMYWTFDTLQARNAHLNLNALRARVVEYVRHVTDVNDAPVLTPFPQPGDEPPAWKPATLRIETPWDLQEVVATSAAHAWEWRVATRQYFQWALATGYGWHGCTATWQRAVPSACRNARAINERSMTVRARRGANSLDRSGAWTGR
jgi:predicted GNAT superfamily acetyltransferase